MLIGVGLLALGVSCRPRNAAPKAVDALASQVIVLANRDLPGSVRLAQQYALKRGIPEANVIALPMPDRESVTWQEFVESVWEPLLTQLLAGRWLEGARFTVRDAIGRSRTAIASHRIAYLVTCRGVPLKISEPPAADVPASGGRPIVRAAAVDSELSLLAWDDAALAGAMPNPWHALARTPAVGRERIIKVSRLDGPTWDLAMALVDGALRAEQDGLRGRAYFDFGGAHPSGDTWLESAAATVRGLGFEIEAERTPERFRATSGLVTPALYFGWYTEHADGPFATPGFAFEPGAIAAHIHSYSAETVRSGTLRWVGPLIARGAAATVGNVGEPYLELSHRPDLLLAALARGERWGDAVYEAMPALSWQAIAIGDPLYRPFPGQNRAAALP